MTVDEVCEELAISKARCYALIQRGDLPALKIGGRGQWLIERGKLEEWIERTFANTDDLVKRDPFGTGLSAPGDRAADGDEDDET